MNVERINFDDAPVFLKEKGYRFKIRKLHVRVGNVLKCLENIILLAKNTESIATIGRFNDGGILNLPFNSTFDFRSDKNNNCDKLVITNQNYLNRHPFHEDLFFDKDKWCLKYLLSLIKRVEPHHEINDDTLVIHIRSGDIFKKKPPHVHKDFYQPPLSYYKHIIENSDHSDILITTQLKYPNPVIKSLLEWNPKIKVSDGDFFSDISILLTARHLVCARSTFSFMLSRLNENLKSVYVWRDNHWQWKDWPVSKTNGLTKHNLKITDYSSDSYIQVRGWKNSRWQRKLMLKFPIEKIDVKCQ